MSDSAASLSYDEFDRVHIHIGHIVRTSGDVQGFQEARHAGQAQHRHRDPKIVGAKPKTQNSKLKTWFPRQNVAAND
jgi:hypothetical protein